MKKLLIVSIIMLLFINCQKKQENSVENIAVSDTKTVEITQKVDSIKTEQQPEEKIQTSTEKLIKDDDKKTLEKLPKVKVTEYSTGISNAELWDNYNKAREEVNYYNENWDFDKLINALKYTAEISQKLQRPDIASWQFNNIGYYSIMEFKRRTDYNSRIKDIEAMPYSEEKLQYIKETKEIFRTEMPLLTSALDNLYDAIELDNLEPDKERQKIINSNINYINSVKDFIND